MGLPGVNIVIENGNLGRTPTTADGVAGLIVVGVAKAGIPLYTPKQIFALKEAETLGLTQANDVTDKVDTWQQIKEFYDEAGSGAELWIMTVAHTKTMTELLDPATSSNSARKLLDAADGRIRLLAINRFIDPSITYSQTSTGGVDADVHTALPKAQALALEYAGQFKPFQTFVDARGWDGVASGLTDLRTYTNSKVSVVLSTTVSGKKSAAVGLALGRWAKLPVQRNGGRVKDGALNISAGFFTNGASIESLPSAVTVAHDKGYIVFRKYVGKAGYYFADDPTATSTTDDFLSIANNRVINKAITLIYAIYSNEINDEVEVSVDGKLSATHVAYLRQIMDNALALQMVNPGECSAAGVYIDPNQNVISTDKLTIVVRITPVGYKKAIEISLGFQNPLN